MMDHGHTETRRGPGLPVVGAESVTLGRQTCQVLSFRLALGVSSGGSAPHVRPEIGLGLV